MVATKEGIKRIPGAPSSVGWLRHAAIKATQAANETQAGGQRQPRRQPQRQPREREPETAAAALRENASPEQRVARLLAGMTPEKQATLLGKMTPREAAATMLFMTDRDKRDAVAWMGREPGANQRREPSASP